MLKSLISLFSILFLFRIFVLGQEDTPVMGTDYSFTTTEDERGDGFSVYSCYLNNLGGKKLLFFNFKAEDKDVQYEALKKIPSDIVVLEPFRNSKIARLKVFGEAPHITWNVEFMIYDAAYSGVPERYKDYVFFWETGADPDRETCTYYLKNIGDKRIIFSGFSFDRDKMDFTELQELIPSPLFLDPGQIVSLTRFRPGTGAAWPYVNWLAGFATFQWNNDPFCVGLVKVLEGSRFPGFKWITGNDEEIQLPGYIIEQIKSSTVHIEDLNSECIFKSGQYWYFGGFIGEAAPLPEITKRYKEYRERIGNCIPAMIVDGKYTNKTSGSKGTLFKGPVENKIQQLVLEYFPVEGNTESYRLFLMVPEAQ